MQIGLSNPNQRETPRDLTRSETLVKVEQDNPSSSNNFEMYFITLL